MRVLVTGGAGFIGSHTVDALLDKGYQVRVLDDLVPPVHIPDQIPDYLPLDDVEFMKGDVRDKAAWEKALEDVDAVFHLAAYQDYLTDFSTFFHTNSVSTALLYEVVVEKRLPIQKIVVASSQAIYGEGLYKCRNDSCLHFEQPVYPEQRRETALREKKWYLGCPTCGERMIPQWTPEEVVLPHNSYSISKYSQEQIALSLGYRYKIPSVGMRYSITQGPRQSFRNAYSGVLRIFAQQVLNGQQPRIYEDGRQLRDYVSVYDVVRANVLVLENERANYQAFNVGGDRQVSVLEYANLIAKRAEREDLKPDVSSVYRFGDTRHIFSDISRLKALGWQPQVPLVEIVDGYLAWAEQQPGFADYSAKAAEHMKQMGTIRPAGEF